MRTPHRLPALVLPVAAVCASLLMAPALAQRAWPTLPMPDDAQTFTAGDELGVNGIPMRIRGFLSARPAHELAQWFRSSLSGTVVESRIGDKLILGQAKGAFYVTVQLEQVAGGTRGLVSTTDFKSAAERREQTQEHKQRWLQRLPAGSRILSHVGTQDDRRLSSQLVYSNGTSEAFNVEALKALMREDGLRLQHEAGGDSGRYSNGDSALAASRVLFFQGDGKEATAVIVRLPDGRASVVLNTVTTMETMR